MKPKTIIFSIHIYILLVYYVDKISLKGLAKPIWLILIVFSNIFDDLHAIIFMKVHKICHL